MDSLYLIIAVVVLILIGAKMALYRFIRFKVDESCVVEAVRKQGGDADFMVLRQQLELSEQRISQVAERSNDLHLNSDLKRVSLATEAAND